jgi:hypothetical protein
MKGTPTRNFCTYPKEHKMAAYKYTKEKEKENIKI